MSAVRAFRGAAAAGALAAVAAPAAHAQTVTGSGCSWSADGGAALASCASWQIDRTVGGGFSDFVIRLTNTTPTGRGPQLFRSIFAFVPTGVTEAAVSNFTASPAAYDLARAPFNGQVLFQGTALGNDRSLVDWTAPPGGALGIGQAGTFAFRIAGAVDISRLGVRAQRVGAGDASQWIAFGTGTVVPEPATCMLVATGLVTLALVGRRRAR